MNIMLKYGLPSNLTKPVGCVSQNPARTACWMEGKWPSQGLYSQEKVHSFDHEDAYRLLDNLFIEGYLKPVAGFNSQKLPGWTHVGLVIDPASDDKHRLSSLVANLKEKLPGIGNYRDWLQVMPLYAEVAKALAGEWLFNRPFERVIRQGLCGIPHFRSWQQRKPGHWPYCRRRVSRNPG